MDWVKKTIKNTHKDPRKAYRLRHKEKGETMLVKKRKRRIKSKKCPRSYSWYALRYGLTAMLSLFLIVVAYGCSMFQHQYMTKPYRLHVDVVFADNQKINKIYKEKGGTKGSIVGFADKSNREIYVPLPISFCDEDALSTLGHEVLHILFPNFSHDTDIWKKIINK